MNLALISDTPAALEACGRLARGLGRAGAEVTLVADPAGLSSPQSPLRPGRACEAPLPLAPLDAAVSDLLGRVDAAGVFLRPGSLQAFRAAHHRAARLRGRPPALLFTGPLLPVVGDALTADLLPRLGYDLICLQGTHQVEELGWLVRGTEHAQQTHQAIGLWSVATEPIGHASAQEPLLVVLVQQGVPESTRESGLLYRRFRDLALASPGWQVRLQPDHELPDDPEQWSEASLAWHWLQDPERPGNLQLGRRQDLPFCLMQASACLGISSPWLLSAMVWGKPTVVLGDYGIRTELNGPLFFASGVMRRLADCLPLDGLLTTPRPNPGWLADLGWPIADGPQRLLRRLEELAR